MHPIRKFPGHFAGAFIPRVGADGVVEVLVVGVLPIQYQGAEKKLQRQKVQTKMPGGCAENLEENANLPVALARELRHEIAGCGDFLIEVGEQIFQRFKPGRNNGPEHQQSFFFAQFKGELRTEDAIEDEGDEVLSPPVWLEARQLLNKIFFSHREPLLAGLGYLARGSSEVAYRYSDILATYRHGQS